MRISDWSSDVCSSDLKDGLFRLVVCNHDLAESLATGETLVCGARIIERKAAVDDRLHSRVFDEAQHRFGIGAAADLHGAYRQIVEQDRHQARSEEHTSEIQSLMRISYAVFRLKKTNKKQQPDSINQ